MVKKQFKALTIPTGSDICGRQLFHWVKKLETVVTEHQEIEKFLPEIEEKLAALDREELLRRVVSLEFGRFLDDYRHGEDLIDPVNERDNFQGRSGKREPRDSYDGKYTRLFINLGKTDGFYPEQLIELVNSNTKGKKIPIGKIDLLKTFSFFEVGSEYAEYLIGALNNLTYLDRRVGIEVAQEKTERPDSGFSEKRPAKWRDRKPEKRSAGKFDGKNKDYKRENKFGKKDKKKKYSK
jgi:ATP-dependent RNA helicase DeaD